MAIKYLLETFLPVFYTLQKDFCSFDSTCINIFILALKSPTYSDFMIKKIIKIQNIKISHLGTFKAPGS